MSDKGLFLIIVISIIVVIVLALGVVVLYNAFQSRILKELEEAHEKEIKYKNSIIENTIEVQERERLRIAKDLHDDIGSKLSIVNLNINLLKSSIDSNDKLDIILDHIESSLTDSITQTRLISHNLYPPILEKFGIKSALESLSKEITRTGELKVTTEIENEWKEFSKSSELHIYRIFQELIHNTIKHAKASEVFISSKEEDGRLKLTYEDNGKGIKDSNASLGLGFSSIQTRIDLLKATMEVDTKRIKGFKVVFTL